MSAAAPAQPVRDEAERWTEAALLGFVHARYSARYGNGNRWALAMHVRNAAGWDATATIDAVAMDTWKGQGLLLHGFEIKTSRGDWLRELRQPHKAAASTRYLDRFWIVAPCGIVKRAELPEAWGLMEPQGRALVVKVQAAPLAPEPLSRDFVACLMRAACHRTAALDELASAHERAQQGFGSTQKEPQPPSGRGSQFTATPA